MFTRDGIGIGTARGEPDGNTADRADVAGDASERLKRVGLVIIGRNEGLRLQRCFDTLPRGVRRVVYVDSGSTDDSVAQAGRRGVEVVSLDMSTPFTAARARNAGLQRLLALEPETEFVQFVDGDCELLPDWLSRGVAALAAEPNVAVVCGRLRERFRDASIYHRLADMEWDGPVGDVFACGGIAMMRVRAVLAVGGFTESLIAGEEPELCVRLRGQGGRVVRLGAEMALHDSAMTRFGQWWNRAVRAGYGAADLTAKHPAAFSRQVVAAIGWGLLWPALAIGTGLVTSGLGLLLLAAYPLHWVKILLGHRRAGTRLGDSALYATSCIVARWPVLLGIARYCWTKARGQHALLAAHK